MWKLRNEFELPAFNPVDAVEHAIQSTTKTILVIDTSDSIGGGASGDSPEILSALLRVAPNIPALVSIVDPESVLLAYKIGVGSKAEFQIGAKEDNRFSSPVAVKGVVLTLHKGTFSYSGGPARGMQTTLGNAAVIAVQRMHVLLMSNATYMSLEKIIFRPVG